MSGVTTDIAPLVVVMGVSGSGKTTIGTLVAHELGVDFVDGDSLHPIENVQKMASGTPLDDDDRWPWLEVVGRTLHERGEQHEGMVIACSALKRKYRERIRSQAPSALFLHLDGSVAVLTRRIEGRSGHFMPPALLSSQMETLEALTEDETARGQVFPSVSRIREVSHRVALAAARQAYEEGHATKLEADLMSPLNPGALEAVVKKKMYEPVYVPLVHYLID